MSEEKRSIDGYEVTTAIYIGDKEILLAEDLTKPEPYMICECSRANPLGIEFYENGVVSQDSLEILAEFVARVAEQVHHVAQQRAERNITCAPLTTDDCIPGSQNADYANQLVVLKQAALIPSARTADHQLLLATGGFGCSPTARGSTVFGKNLITGQTMRYERCDVAGVIRPDLIPEWAKRQLAALPRSGPDKPSVRSQLAKAKDAAAQRDMDRESMKNKEHSL